MKGQAPLFSSASPHWSTPAAVYDGLNAEFQFTLDPCPLGESLGLLRSWKGERVFCNPPYGRGRGLWRWLVKATEPTVAVYLLPSRTDTYWWHEYAMKADEIRFVRGRLKFGGAKHNAPFPSAILVYDNSSR